MNKDDQTLLNFCYLIFAVLTGFICYKLVQYIGVKTNWIEKFSHIFSYVATAVAVVFGIGGTWWLRSDKDRHEFFLSSITEMRKVTWPSALDTRKMTIVVCVVVVIFAVIVGAFDFIWAKAIEMLLS